MYIFVFIANQLKLLDLNVFDTITEVPISSNYKNYKDKLNLEDNQNADVNIVNEGIFIDTKNKIKDSETQNNKTDKRVL